MDASVSSLPNHRTQFQRALDDFISDRATDEKFTEFLQLCRNEGSCLSPDAVNEQLAQVKAEKSMKTPAFKIFSKITRTLEGYSGCISKFGMLLASIYVSRLDQTAF
jgi:hypothetical protein